MGLNNLFFGKKKNNGKGGGTKNSKEEKKKRKKEKEKGGDQTEHEKQIKVLKTLYKDKGPKSSMKKYLEEDEKELKKKAQQKLRRKAEIEYLIGLETEWSSQTKEIEQFQNVMKQYRETERIIEEEEEEEDNKEKEEEKRRKRRRKMSEHEGRKIVASSKHKMLLLRVHYKDDHKRVHKQTIRVNAADTPEVCLKAFIKKIKTRSGFHGNPEEYILRSEEDPPEYYDGDDAIASYFLLSNYKSQIALIDVRCVKKTTMRVHPSRYIDYSFTKSDEKRDAACYFETHEAITHQDKEEHQINKISIWDMEKDVEIQLREVVFPPNSVAEGIESKFANVAGVPCNIYFHCQIMHQGHILGEAYSKATPFDLSDYPKIIGNYLKFKWVNHAQKPITKTKAKTKEEVVEPLDVAIMEEEKDKEENGNTVDKKEKVAAPTNFVKYYHLPREAVLAITAYATHRVSKGGKRRKSSARRKDVCVCSANVPMFNHENQLKSGVHTFGLLTPEKPANGYVMRALKCSNKSPIMSICFKKYALPLQAPTELLFSSETRFPEEQSFEKVSSALPDYMLDEYHAWDAWISKEYGIDDEQLDMKRVMSLIDTDPLYSLNAEEKALLWKAREKLTPHSRALCKFLQSVPTHFVYARLLSKQLLYKWKLLSGLEAIGLLHYAFGDFDSRRYALSIIDTLPTKEVALYMLQLTQCLKYELHHDSALTRFLLQRAVRAPDLVGHNLFFNLKSELHLQSVQERNCLILKEYLSVQYEHRITILIQTLLHDQFLKIALKVQSHADPKDQKRVLQDGLRDMVFPKRFSLPINPFVQLTGIHIDKCRVMGSAKKPLWLTFVDEFGETVRFMFKAGDDVRQDMLTLQLLRIMDRLWKASELDFQLSVYGCVCTGYMTGFIEVVSNSATIHTVTKLSGNSFNSTKKFPIVKYLKQKDDNANRWDEVVESFLYSTAGYCVATYILGIGDRHNENIMLKDNGRLFHIDFGHFLGHFKFILGYIPREKAPFVFTPMYAEMFGGEKTETYERFVKKSCNAYNCLREPENLQLMINLLLLTIATGIPELKSTDDIAHLIRTTQPHVSNVEAEVHFRKLVRLSLSNKYKQFEDGLRSSDIGKKAKELISKIKK